VAVVAVYKMNFVSIDIIVFSLVGLSGLLFFLLMSAAILFSALTYLPVRRARSAQRMVLNTLSCIAVAAALALGAVTVIVLIRLLCPPIFDTLLLVYLATLCRDHRMEEIVLTVLNASFLLSSVFIAAPSQ